MKEKSSNQKNSQRNGQASARVSAAGSAGVAITPPAYGMESVDQIISPESGSGLTLQAKLTVTSASDATEREADQVAEQALAQLQRPALKPFQPHISTHPAPASVSPKLLAPVGFNGGDVSGEIASSIKQAKGSGGALDKSLRTKMDHAFGANFSGVRIHTDQKADTLNRAIQANAFTTGRDIFFRQGEYNPQNDAGQRLIAHELTHVIQQAGTGRETVNRATSQNIIQRAIKIKQYAKVNKNWVEQKPIAYDVSKMEDTLFNKFTIREENFPGLKSKLEDLSAADATFKNLEALVKTLRAEIWNPHLTGIFADQESENEEQPEDALVTGMKNLQEAGLKYRKPDASKKMQPDYWESEDILPYALNCWETVLLAARLQGLIDHDVFVEADQKVNIGSGSSNVMSEAIYAAAEDNKIEWQYSHKDTTGVKNAFKKLAQIPAIPAGQVIVIGRDGQHVGVSTGKRRAAEKPDTKALMPKDADQESTSVLGHEWIENDSRGESAAIKTYEKDLKDYNVKLQKYNNNPVGDAPVKPIKPLVSDLRVSTLEDALEQFQGASGFYWASLPTDVQVYLTAKASLEQKANA